MNTTINNPVIPCVMSLPGGHLQQGNLIVIHGQPTYNSNRFCVSLVCGQQRELGDIAFQLTSHFDTSWVIRNSKLNKEWGVEEGTTTHKFPFKRLQPFKIEIFTSPSSYLITVDGNHHCEYIHRVSYSEANTLQITGDVQVSMIEFRSANTFPTFPSSNRLNVAYPPLPFASLINGPLSVGNEIQVHGQVKPHPNRFHINLQQGCQSYPHPTMVFHFNPRYEGGQRTIVMNSFIGSWGSEQRVAVPRNLLPGNTFVLAIRRQPSYFEVSVNGSVIATYNHRIAADMVDSVSIDGDVIIHKVVAY
ncbi:galectin-4-like isoform X1 [Daphnia pulicaria]|uniref:galectin-4-like isoform X1 n=1 Tax=Daphnia pulicaria TaxID=35523 RepID=UPI001EEB1C65|nr:galectin-4-like isoform X1 [Daphnia pulicaria]